jgi:hypothetical protein
MAAMARSSQESQKLSFAISGALLLLLALGYLFVPRWDLGDKSPLSVLVSPNKEDVFTCVGGRSYASRENTGPITEEEFKKRLEGTLTLAESIEANSSKNGCDKYSGTYAKKKEADGSVRSRGLGWADVGSLISKDLTSTGGLLLLLGASPAIGFLVFQRISGSRENTAPPKKAQPDIKKQPETSSPLKLATKELSDRLEHLQSLHQKGLITSEEFSIKKKELLDEI